MNRIFTNPKAMLCILALLFACNIYSQTNPADIQHMARIDQNLQVPTRIAIDNADNIYVSDYGQKCIVKYDASGNYIETISLNFQPLGIAINNLGDIFVGTEDGGNIYKIVNGSPVLFYDLCLMPSSMTFSPNGNLFVVDSKQKKVLEIDVTATLVNTIGLGTLLWPSSIAVDSRNQRILVGEHGGTHTSMMGMKCWVSVFDMAGNYITKFGSSGNGDGQFYRIQGIAIGRCGNIYVNEPFQGKVSIFDENLNYITKFGAFGSNIGELNVPLDIKFDSQERIIMASMNNSSLEIFSITDTLPTTNIVNSDATICAGQTTDITIDFTGTAPFNFTYSIDGIAQASIVTSDNPYVLTVSNPGLYEITSLSDANYTGTCFSGSALIAVTNPQPSSTISVGSIAICDGTSTNIPINFTGTAPWTFTYTVDGTNPETIITNANPYMLNTANAGLYEVQSVSDAGCVGIPYGSADVTVNSLPVASVTTLDSEICDGQATYLNIGLTGTPPFTFTYNLNGLNPTTINTLNYTYTIPVSEDGNYIVSSVMDASCTNSTEQGYANITVNQLPTATLDNLNASYCDGDLTPLPITFAGTAPWTLTYSLDDTVLTNTINNIYANPYNLMVDQSGNYTINMVTDANCNGAIFTGSTDVIMLSSAVSDFSYVQNGLEVSFTNNSLNASSYLWDFGDGNTSTDINPINIYPSAGIYQITLTATNQCNDSIYSLAIDLLVMLENIDIHNFVKLYPNPTSGIVTLEIQNTTDSGIKLDIMSANGQKVFSKQFSSQNILENIDLSKYSSGIYTARIVSDEFTKTSKLILYK